MPEAGNKILPFERGSTLRRRFRRLLPGSVLRIVNEVRFWRYRRRFRGLERRKVFSTIYQERLFGEKPGESFYSGDGSIGRFADSYCELVAELVREKKIHSIIDLGCGDFRIGARLAPLVEKYVGVDIVPELISHNQVEFGSGQVSFVCLDIVDDSLPAGDLCLIRQVLQHLNNSEIASVLNKLQSYKWVLVTENVPTGEVKFPNVDHVHGPETRLLEGSGVFLTKPPFSLTAAQIWESTYDDVSILLTVLMSTESHKQ